MTTTTRFNLPAGCRLHAPSWQSRHAAALAREVDVIRLPVDPSRWPSGAPLWARERFCTRRAAWLVAYSVDAHGRIVRGWFTSPGDQAAYDVDECGTFGPITCPIEAVSLAHLRAGEPGVPAHLLIGAERGWPGYREAVAGLVA
jgi:hypothetical protein